MDHGEIEDREMEMKRHKLVAAKVAESSASILGVFANEANMHLDILLSYLMSCVTTSVVGAFAESVIEGKMPKDRFDKLIELVKEPMVKTLAHHGVKFDFTVSIMAQGQEPPEEEEVDACADDEDEDEDADKADDVEPIDPGRKPWA